MCACNSRIRSRITELLEQLPGVEILAACKDGDQAIREIERQHPNLLFLDIQMPGVDGFEVVSRIGPEKMTVTVFVTAYDDYAVRAFDVSAIDYLLKPFSDDRFEPRSGARKNTSKRRKQAS